MEKKFKRGGHSVHGYGVRFVSFDLFFLATTKSWLLGYLPLSLLSMFRYGCLLFSLSKSWIKLLHLYCRDLVHRFRKKREEKVFLMISSVDIKILLCLLVL